MKVKLERNKPHQSYKIDGVRVPGYSTIASELSKGWMKKWANSEGLLGHDLSKITEAVDIGSIAHFLIDCHLNGNEPDLTDYAQVDIDKAETAYLAYLECEKKYNLKMIKNELQLVSYKYRYGGTCDLYCDISGMKTLIDLKTSKAFYPDMKIQLAAYRQLLIENGYPVEQQIIFRIDKETGRFEDIPITLTKEFELFLALFNVYKFRKELKI